MKLVKKNLILFSGLFVSLLIASTLCLVGCQNKETNTNADDPNVPKIEVNATHITQVNDKNQYSAPVFFDNLFSGDDNKEARNFILSYLNEKYVGHSFSVDSFDTYVAAFTDVKPLYTWHYICRDENNHVFKAQIFGGPMGDDSGGAMVVKYIMNVQDNYEEIVYKEYLENELQKTISMAIDSPCVISIDSLKDAETTQNVYTDAWEFLKKDSGIMMNVLVKNNVSKEVQEQVFTLLQDKFDRECIKFYLDKTNSFDAECNASDLKHKKPYDYAYFSNNSSPLF